MFLSHPWRRRTATQKNIIVRQSGNVQRVFVQCSAVAAMSTFYSLRLQSKKKPQSVSIWVTFRKREREIVVGGALLTRRGKMGRGGKRNGKNAVSAFGIALSQNGEATQQTVPPLFLSLYNQSRKGTIRHEAYISFSSLHFSLSSSLWTQSHAGARGRLP